MKNTKQNKLLGKASFTLLSVLILTPAVSPQPHANEEHRRGKVAVCHLDKNQNYQLIYEETARALHHLEFHLSEHEGMPTPGDQDTHLPTRTSAAARRNLGAATPALNPDLSPSAIKLGDLLAVNGQCPKKYKIGDIGPAGGTVFHVTQAGFSGLEAMPPSLLGVRIWGCTETLIGANSLSDGQKNTSKIVTRCGANSAADYASKASVDGVTLHWYLPSLSELLLFRDAVSAQHLQGYPLGKYWSSTEAGPELALRDDISNNDSNGLTEKNKGGYALPIHQFSWFIQAGSQLP